MNFLPLVGGATVRLAPPRSPWERAPEHAESTAPVPPAEAGRPKAPQDRPAEALRRTAPVPADPWDAAFAAAAAAVVEAHLDDPSFSVRDLAHALGVSRSGLYRRFEAALMPTPQRLIQDLRLRRAADLLEARAGRVGEVAFLVGYRSTAQFSRAFRGRFGVPPSSYAARRRSQEATPSPSAPGTEPPRRLPPGRGLPAFTTAAATLGQSVNALGQSVNGRTGREVDVRARGGFIRRRWLTHSARLSWRTVFLERTVSPHPSPHAR